MIQEFKLTTEPKTFFKADIVSSTGYKTTITYNNKIDLMRNIDHYLKEDWSIVRAYVDTVEQLKSLI